ncbi:MAG TPA: DUF4388 domain-containing protein [Pyrinomonadaceae bacterium]|nr:DUF4388 domain-containing protein [Pyrinomonadaceae bacterium]
MDGLLSDRPLAELISEISSTRASGALRLARERARGVVYFEEGRVVAALSNLRAHRLAEFARRTGAVGGGRLEELARAGPSDESVAAELVRSGTLTPEGLAALLTAQSAEVLRALLRWDDGAWEFDPRVRLAQAHRAGPEAGALLLERARELDEERLAALLPDSELLAPPAEAPGVEPLTRLGLSPAEGFVFSRVTGQTTLAELLLVGGLPEAETRRAVYALALAGLLARPNVEPTFTPEAIRKAAASGPASGSASGPAPAPPASADADAADEAQATSTAGRPTDAHAQPPAAGPQSPPAASQPSGGGTYDEVRAAMEELLDLARKETHYEVLGVVRSAAPEEIKRAYHSIARRLHPDRFRRDAAGEFVRQLDVSFARVTQAYEVLKDPSLRATYDLKLTAQSARGATRTSVPGARDVYERGGEGRGGEGRGPVADAPPSADNAEQKFQHGQEALRNGDYATARRLFGEAALVVPRQARYRAFYGRELARDRATRRQAEAELQAAVSLDEKNPTYRVMLAELYLEVGLRRRAEGELRRALTHAPGHEAALRLLKTIDASG